jgi:hypothetical protein
MRPTTAKHPAAFVDETKRQRAGMKGAQRHGGKPIYWPQDMLRRAAMALRECGSSDIFRLARVALEAAIRSESDLLALLPEPAATQRHIVEGTAIQTEQAHAAPLFG